MCLCEREREREGGIVSGKVFNFENVFEYFRQLVSYKIMLVNMSLEVRI